MTYEEIRKIAKTGDVLLLQGTSFISKIIRVFTAQQFSHAALLWWWNDGLYIAEMYEGIGFQIMPASQKIAEMQGQVYFGRAPKQVEDKADTVEAFINAYRDDKSRQGYGYFSLLKVWWSQVTGKDLQSREKVCSTFVEAAWASAGFRCDDLESPGGLVPYLQSLIPLDAAAVLQPLPATN